MTGTSIWAPKGEQGDPGPQGPEGPQGPQGPEGPAGPGFEQFVTFRDTIYNSTDPDKGTAIVGRSVQIVANIAALKALLKTSNSKYASTMGYYNAGDGGHGNYRLDLADTTSVDNGGTIIVADDGGRWKLVGTELCAKQFGAKGDGVTNDSPAVIKWAAAMSVGVAKWGSGTFLLDNPVQFPSGPIIEGDGPNNTIILHGPNISTSGSFITTGGTGGTIYQDFSINGNHGNVGAYTNAELDMGGSSTPNQATNLRLYNFTNIGITSAAKASFERCEFTGLGSPTAGATFGIWADNANAEVIVEKCIFRNLRLNGVFSGGITNIFNSVFQDNHRQTSVGGGQVASGATLKSSIVMGCKFRAALSGASSGIECDVAPTTVIGCDFEGHTQYGIILQSSDSHIIMGNQIRSAGTCGIQANAGISSWIIQGNRVASCPIGVRVVAGASDYYVITGNNLVGNTTPLVDLGTGADKVVHSNAGVIVASTIAVGASPFTWTNNTGSQLVLTVFGGTVSSITLNARQVANSSNQGINVPRKGTVVITYSAAPQIEAYGG